MYVVVAGNHHLTIADSSLRLGFQPSHRLWRRLKQQLLHKLVLLSFLIQEVWNWIPSTRDTRNLRPTEESSGEKFAIHVLRGGHFALITQLEPSASSLCAQMYWLLVQCMNLRQTTFHHMPSGIPSQRTNVRRFVRPDDFSSSSVKTLMTNMYQRVHITIEYFDLYHCFCCCHCGQ